MNLEELVLEFSANTASLDATIDRAVAKARSAAAQIDQVLSRSYGKGAGLNLTPKVDHRHLEALNKHLGIKKQHFQDVQRHFNSKPLTPKVDTSQIQQAISEVKAFKRELVDVTVGGGSILITTTIQHSIDTSNLNSSLQSGANQFRKAGDEVAEKIAKKVGDTRVKGPGGGGLLGLATAPLRLLGAGIFQGLGIALAARIVSGISEGLERKLGLLGKKTEEYLVSRGAKIGESVAQNLGYGEGLKDVAKDIAGLGKAIDDMLDPTNFAQAFEEFEMGLARAIDRAIVQGKPVAAMSEMLQDAFVKPLESSLNRIKEFARKNSTEPRELAREFNQFAKQEYARAKTIAAERGQPFEVTEKEYKRQYSAELERRFMDKPEREFQVLGTLIRLLSTPVKFQNMVAQVGAQRDVEERAKKVTVPPLQQGQTGYVVVTGGFQQQRGRGAYEIASLVQPMFPQSQIIPVRNTYSDRRPTDTKSLLLDLLKKVGYEPTPEMVFTFQNLEKVFGTAIKGVNPDSVRMAAVMKAIEKQQPNTPVSAVSFSGGVYTTEQAIQLNADAGGKAKGLAVGAGLYGLSGRQNPNFKTVIFKEDPLSFPFQSGLFKPPASTSIVGTPYAPSANLHNPKRYFSNPVVGSQMESHLPGYVPLAGGEGSKEDLLFLANRIPSIYQSLNTIKKFFSDTNFARSAKGLEQFQGAFSELFDIIRKNYAFDVGGKATSEINELVAGGDPQYTRMAEDFAKAKQGVSQVIEYLASSYEGLPKELPNFEPEQQSQYITALTKLLQDTPNLERTLSVLKGAPETSEYAFYTKQPGFGEKRADDLQKFISYLKEKILINLPAPIQKSADEYIQYLTKLQKAIMALVKEGTPIPQEILDKGDAIYSLTQGIEQKPGVIPQTKMPPSASKLQQRAQEVLLEKAMREALLGLEGITKSFTATGRKTRTLKTVNLDKAKEHAQVIIDNYERAIADIDKQIETLSPQARTGTAQGNRLANFKSRVTRAYNTAARIASSLEGTIKDPLQAIEQSVKSGSSTHSDVVSKQIRGLGQVFSSRSKELSLATGSEESSRIAAEILSNAEKARTALNTLVTNLGKDANTELKGLVKAARQRITGAEKKARSIVGNSEVMPEVPAVHADSIGSNIAGGMAGGITDKINAVEQAGRILGKTVIAAAESELEIKSPSRVFVRIGGLIVQGLKIGVQGLDAVLGTDFSNKLKQQTQQIETETQKTARQVGEGIGQTAAGAANATVKTAQGASQEIGRIAQDVLPIARSGFAGFRETFQREFQGLEAQFPILRNLKGLFKDIAVSALSFIGASSFGGLFIQVGRTTFQTALEFERLKVALDFSTGGQGVETLEKLRQRSDDLGVSFKESARGYQKLSVGLLGTSLQGETNRIFEGVQSAIATRALSSEQSDRVYTAFGQIGAKNHRVSLEELSGQLGDAGISMGTIAKSVSMTTGELVKLVEAGNLTAETLLPKLTTQLSLESQSGLAAAANTAQAKLNRLNNQLEGLQATLGGFTLDAVKPAIDATAKGLEFLNNNAKTAARIAEVLAIALGITVVRSLAGLAARLGIGATLMKALGLAGLNAQGVLLNLGTVAARVSGMLKGLLVPTAIVAGLELLLASLNRDSQKLQDVNAALETSIRNIEKAYRKAAGAAEEFNDKSQPVAEDPVLRAADTFVVNPINTALDFYFGGGEEARKRREAETGQKDFRFRTNAEAAQDDIIANRVDKLRGADTALTKTASRLGDTKFIDQTIQQLKEVDLQIQRIQAKQNVVRLEGSTEEVQKLQQELDKLQENRKSVLEKVFGNQGDLENFKTQLKAGRDELNRLVSIGAVTEATSAPTLNYINQLLKETERQMGALENITKQTAVAFENLKIKVGNVNAAFENAQYQGERSLNTTKTRILEGQATGDLGDNAARQANIKTEQEYYRQRLSQLQDFTREYQAQIDQLAQAERDALETYLGKPVESAGPGDIKQVQDLYKDKLTANQETILEARQRILELQKEMDAAGSTIAQGAVELRTTLRDTNDQARELKQSAKDFVKEYGNFLRGIANQTKDAALTIQGLKNQIRMNDFKADLLRALTKTSKGIFGSINDLMIRYLDEAGQLAQQAIEQQRQQSQNQNQITDLRQQNQQQGVQYDNLGRQIGRFNKSNEGNFESNLNSNGGVGTTNNYGVLNPVPGTTRAKNSRGYATDTGLDIYAPIGSKIVAPASGTLEYAETGHNRQSSQDADTSTPGFQPSYSIRIKLDTPIEYKGKTYPFAYFTHLRNVNPGILNQGEFGRNKGTPLRIEAGQELGEVGVANKVPHLHIGFTGDREQRSFLNFKEMDEVIYGGGRSDKPTRAQGQRPYTIYSGGRDVKTVGQVYEHYGNGAAYREKTFEGRAERFVGDRLVKDIVLAQNGNQSVPVPSPVAGIARLVDKSAAGGYGNLVEILDAQGKLIARLAHLASFAPGLQSGQQIAYGQTVGIQGYTGNTRPVGPKGTHLHVELPPQSFAKYFNDLKSGTFASGAVSAGAPQFPPTAPQPAATSSLPSFMNRLLHIIAAGESGFDSKAINTNVSNGPRGAFQFIPSTRQRAIQLTGKDPWTGSIQQQAETVIEWIKKVHPKAYTSTQKGDLTKAIALLRNEWTSLPGAAENMKWTGPKGQALLQKYISGNFAPKFSVGGSGGSVSGGTASYPLAPSPSAQLPNVGMPNVNLAAGGEAIGRLEAANASIAQLNQVLRGQNLDQFKTKANSDTTAAIEQLNDAYKNQRKALRELTEQGSDLGRQFQPESIGKALVTETTNIKRQYRALRESYEQQSIDLQKNIASAQESIKTYSTQIPQLRASGRPEDLIVADNMARAVAVAQRDLPKYQQQLKQVREEHTKLRGEETQAIQFKLGDILKNSGRESSDSLKEIRREMRDTGKQYEELTGQFQQTSFARELDAALTDVGQRFGQFQDSLVDRREKLTRLSEDLNTEIGSIVSSRAETTDQGVIDAINTVLEQRRETLKEVLSALAKTELQTTNLPQKQYDAIIFTTNEALRKATEESVDSLRNLQRSMRNTGQEYKDLVDQFQAPSFGRELETRLAGVDRSFEGFSDSLKDRGIELARSLREQETQLASTEKDLENAVKRGDVQAYALIEKQDQQQVQVAETTAALRQNQAQQARLPYDRLTGRLVERMRVNRQTRQEREQYLADTQANALESRAGWGEANFVDEYQLAKIRASAATIRENIRFQVEMEGFAEMVAKLNLTAEQAAIAKQKLVEINQVNLGQIQQQADLLRTQLKEGLQPAFETLFQDLILGGKTLGEIFNNLIGSVAQLLAQLAARALVKSLFGGIFKDGGTVEGFAHGGEIRNYASGGDVTALGLSVAAAMKREGPQAVPIVASVGEEVLSTRNGDAQFYRALKQRGAWSEIKVNNFADGGTVSPASSGRNVSSSRGGNLVVNVPVTVEKGADLSADKAGRLSQSISAVVRQHLINEKRPGGLLHG